MGALVLIGARGAGKSTVGPLVAAALGRAFVDLDDVVEARAGATSAELFATRGEPAFRDLEAAALREALARPDLVLALGGGAPLRVESRALLRAHAVVYLCAPAELLAARVAADPRTPARRPPLRPGGPLAEARALLAERDAVYRAVARHVLDAAQPLERLVEELVRTASQP